MITQELPSTKDFTRTYIRFITETLNEFNLDEFTDDELDDLCNVTDDMCLQLNEFIDRLD